MLSFSLWGVFMRNIKLNLIQHGIVWQISIIELICRVHLENIAANYGVRACNHL